jgi:hypothetical protein
MCFKPKDASRRAWIDTGPLPPGCFISAAMDFAMMSATKRNRELVADLAAERPAAGQTASGGHRRGGARTPNTAVWQLT